MHDHGISSLIHMQTPSYTHKKRRESGDQEIKFMYIDLNSMQSVKKVFFFSVARDFDLLKNLLHNDYFNF